MQVRSQFPPVRAMELRWPAAIALWTLLIGPVMDGPPSRSSDVTARVSVVVRTAEKQTRPNGAVEHGARLRVAVLRGR
jgi:hypothetical protein